MAGHALFGYESKTNMELLQITGPVDLAKKEHYNDAIVVSIRNPAVY
jgi:hypothetical protein